METSDFCQGMQNRKINFFYQDVVFDFRNRNRLKLFLEKMVRKEGRLVRNMNVVFCSDDALLEINRQFLNHDYYTDIITFPLSKIDEPVDAELYISIDRIRENAKTAGISFKNELHRVIFHGCLHLVGYNDKSSQQIKTIRERENKYLRLYFEQ